MKVYRVFESDPSLRVVYRDAYLALINRYASLSLSLSLSLFQFLLIFSISFPSLLSLSSRTPAWSNWEFKRIHGYHTHPNTLFFKLFLPSLPLSIHLLWVQMGLLIIPSFRYPCTLGRCDCTHTRLYIHVLHIHMYTYIDTHTHLHIYTTPLITYRLTSTLLYSSRPHPQREPSPPPSPPPTQPPASQLPLLYLAPLSLPPLTLSPPLTELLHSLLSLHLGRRGLRRWIERRRRRGRRGRKRRRKRGK